MTRLNIRHNPNSLRRMKRKLPFVLCCAIDDMITNRTTKIIVVQEFLANIYGENNTTFPRFEQIDNIMRVNEEIRLFHKMK